ncbi:conserved Plasmodium protein, unknown function [Plasmodium malariae]|uniref:PH domain-containing protein n=1 Tax=Plasmodium malariae TaxID=5858 RepID=A0A1D3TEE6_PLAMA|nr:conserved Plasmodium protein, unknown function [Plasmodium malariae]SCP03320.1 conserved Plasmodium protein, unknown function [Plasmodium malariae]
MEERNVLEYAEVIIDRQRDKINELEKKLLELRSSSEELQKNALKNDEENKTLRLELNRKNENDMLLSMQMNKGNEFLQKISVLEKQLLKRDTLLEELNNLLKKRKYEYEILLQEKENLINTINTLRIDICKSKKDENLKQQEFLHNEKENEKLLNLYKNNNEELNITKRCLIQIESELHMYKKQNEQQKIEIQKLYKIISCMNKERILTPPVILALQNDYGKKLKNKSINEHVQLKAIQDSSPSIITNKENKLTTLKQMNNEKNTQEKLAYSENLLKLNLMQSEEQKDLFNKIVEMLNRIKDTKTIDNKVDFFFSSNVLHYFRRNTAGKLTSPNNSSINNSDGSTTESEDGLDQFSNVSSYIDSKKQMYKKKTRKKKEKKTRKKKKKKKDDTVHMYSSAKINKMDKIIKKKYEQKGKCSITGTDDNTCDHYMSTDSISTESANVSDNSMRNSSMENSILRNNSVSNSSGSYDYSSDFNTSNEEFKSEDRSRSDTEETDNAHLKDKYSYNKGEKYNLLNYENYKERFIGVTNKEIFIYNKKNDEEPMYIIRCKNLKRIKMLYNNQIYVIKHTPFYNISEKHYFLIKNDDKSLRIFYALQYAGFIKENKDKFIGDQENKKNYMFRRNNNYNDNKIQNLNNQSERNSCYTKLNSTTPEVMVNIFTPNGIDESGKDVPYTCNNVLLKGDPKNNHLIFINFEKKNSFINCENYYKKYKNNKFILYFNSFKDQHIIIPKTKDSANLLHVILNKMIWKNSNHNKEVCNKPMHSDGDIKSSTASSYTYDKFTKRIDNYKDIEETLERRERKEIKGVKKRGINKGKEGEHEYKNESYRKSESQRKREIEREGSAKESVRESAKKSVRESAKESVRESARESIRESARESIRKSKGGSRGGSEGESKGGSEGGKESDTGRTKNDTPSLGSTSSKKGDTFLIKDNVLYISKDGTPFKKDQVDFNDYNTFKFMNKNLKILKDDYLNELTFVKSEENKDEETYIFQYPKREKYNHLVSKLNNNNFDVIEKDLYDKIKKEDKKDEDETKMIDNKSETKDEEEVGKKEKADQFIKNNQVVVIEKGVLSIYKDYGNENSVPIMRFISDSSDVHANEQNGEISIKDSSKDSNEKIVLDCLNKTEFHRWKSALCFGGFIKGENISISYMNLKKHIFSINLFDNLNIKSLVHVEGKFIYIYPNNKINKPLFSFDKEKIELTLFPELRKIRIYLQRETIYEQRYDITIPLARDFTSIKEQIEKNNFHTLSSKKTQKIKKPFVLCKSNIIAIHKDKYKLKPELILEKKNCTVSFDKNKHIITFKIKNKFDTAREDTKTITLTNEINFNKWMVTLKLASFIPGYNFEGSITFPTIAFGHTCPEAASLLKKRSSLMNLFKK